VKKISEKNSKPIIASMGGVAASGGYYIALGADTIIANPGTVTGSIGVIMTYPVVQELLEKLGIGQETIKSGKLKDAGSLFKDLTENERKYFQGLIDDLHKQFVTAVSKERNLSFSVIDKLATGQVFTGTQAFANGLIDLLGTMEDAVLLAAQKASQEGRPVMVYPPEEKKGLLDILFGDIFQRGSLANLNLYPQPEYKMIYKIR
jgi:protease-4